MIELLFTFIYFVVYFVIFAVFFLKFYCLLVSFVVQTRVMLILNRVEKKKEKPQKRIIETQERAFWNLYRPPVWMRLHFSLLFHKILQSKIIFTREENVFFGKKMRFCSKGSCFDCQSAEQPWSIFGYTVFAGVNLIQGVGDYIIWTPCMKVKACVLINKKNFSLINPLLVLHFWCCCWLRQTRNSYWQRLQQQRSVQSLPRNKGCRDGIVHFYSNIPFTRALQDYGEKSLFNVSKISWS